MIKLSDKEILEGVLEEFKKLAAIPRPSGHIEKISLFLKDYFSELGFKAEQDAVKNVIVNAPPTEGFEKAPLIVLQGHMDMVAVASEGVPFNPVTDPIRLIRDDKYLRAAGTSLGADDGMGIALVMFLAKNMTEHGPLRFIFTVDEETGMSGAEFLDEKHLKDAKYLINCDSEQYDEIIMGCSGGITMDFQKEIKRVPVTKKHIVEISLTGLLGGHSGERIGDNRANAIKAVAAACREMDREGGVELIAINGGSAKNAIPSFASCIVATDIDIDTLRIMLMEEGRKIYFMHDEDGAAFTVKETSSNLGAVSGEDADNILRFINLFHSGTYAVTRNVVETSANLGIIKTLENRVDISVMPRSSREKKLDCFLSAAYDLSALTGFTLLSSERTPVWSSDKGNVLAEKMSGIFKSIVGEPMLIKEMHAAVECGYFYRKNPNLEIVSIGTTNEDIHSPREKLVLSTVAPITRLIEGVILDA